MNIRFLVRLRRWLTAQLARKPVVMALGASVAINGAVKDSPITINQGMDPSELRDIIESTIQRTGVPVKPLLAVLKKIGEERVAVANIAWRLDIAADELLRLRKDLNHLNEKAPELSNLTKQISTLIDDGELKAADLALQAGNAASATRLTRKRRAATRQSDEHWVPLSDLMTGLMMIFMLLMLLFMIKSKTELSRVKQQEANAKTEMKIAREQFDNVKKIALLYNFVKNDLFRKLSNQFSVDLKKWDAELDRDLTIRFKNPQLLFENQSAMLRQRFIDTLDDFFPRYLSILYSDEYRKLIDEIRIEGHTSSQWVGSAAPSEAYMRNMALSQERTRSVLKVILQMRRPASEQDWLVAHLTANGLSSSKPRLGSNGAESPELSRRVEFRVRTNSDASMAAVIDASRR